MRGKTDERKMQMKGWLLYNGSEEVEKVNILVEKMLAEAQSLGYSLEGVRSTEVLAIYDGANRSLLQRLSSSGGLNCPEQSNQPGLTGKAEKPDYILFWDKDFYLAKHLEIMGYKVFNNSRAIETCDNKVLMHQAFAGSGLRVPKTIIGPLAFFENRLDRAYYDSVVEALGEDFILKEAFGSFGMQVYMVSDFEKFQALMKDLANKRFIMQENIKSSRGRDLRINIIGDKIIGAMERKNPNDFRANITLGGRGFPVDLTQEQADLALRAHRLLGLDFSGVDLLYGENEEPILCEVNSNVNFISYENTSGISIADKLLEYLEKEAAGEQSSGLDRAAGLGNTGDGT